MRSLLFLAPILLATACGIIIPGPPDEKERSHRIQMLAFGEILVGDGNLDAYHASPDEQTQRWLYWLQPEQSLALSRRCLRGANVALRLRGDETEPGCVIWERREGGVALTISIAPRTLEIHDVGKAEDVFASNPTRPDAAGR